jgi:hypothetical protein
MEMVMWRAEMLAKKTTEMERVQTGITTLPRAFVSLFPSRPPRFRNTAP